MQFFILMVLLAVIAAATLLQGRWDKPEPETAGKKDVQELIAGARMTEQFIRILDVLRKVMEHPQLGGPGFLMLQFPISGYGWPEAVVQYPNIREVLYRRIIRGELAQDELEAIGIPAELFERGVEFAAESGGMVLVRAEAGKLPPELERMLADCRGRGELLHALAEVLAGQYPDMTVRAVGSDILLTPHTENPHSAI